VVTVTGRHLDSVAKPRINVTVVVTRMLNNTMSRSTPAVSNSEVLFLALNSLKTLHCLCMIQMIKPLSPHCLYTVLFCQSFSAGMSATIFNFVTYNSATHRRQALSGGTVDEIVIPRYFLKKFLHNHPASYLDKLNTV